MVLALFRERGFVVGLLLSTQSAASAAKVIPGIRGGLQAAGLPAPVQEQVIAGFRTCFHDSATAKDPTVTPASCQRLQAQGPSQAGGPPPGARQRIGQVAQSAAVTARKDDFVTSIVRTLWYEVAVYLASFLLVFLLPRGPEGHREEVAAAEAMAA